MLHLLPWPLWLLWLPWLPVLRLLLWLPLGLSDRLDHHLPDSLSGPEHHPDLWRPESIADQLRLADPSGRLPRWLLLDLEYLWVPGDPHLLAALQGLPGLWGLQGLPDRYLPGDLRSLDRLSARYHRGLPEFPEAPADLRNLSDLHNLSDPYFQ